MSEGDLERLFYARNRPYIQSFFAIDYKKDDVLLEWLVGCDENLSEYYQPLFREQKDNLSYFIGGGISPHFASPYIATFASTSDFYAEPQSVYINEMYRLTLDQVSLVVSHELIPDVLPNSEDYSDKVACNVTKDWLDSIHYDLNTDLWRQRWEMQKKIFGEAFAIVAWNPNKGDLRPDNLEEEQLDDEDLNILDLPDSIGMIKKNNRIGDIDYITPMPWMVHFEPKDRFQDSNWFFWKELVDIDYLKKKYPKANFSGTAPAVSWDTSASKWKENPNKRTVYNFYHRSHEFLPTGRYIVATDDNVLINEDLSAMPTLLNNQQLPIVRFADMDLGIGTRGVPILFRNCKNVNEAYNRVTNQIYNNLEMESPKLFVHETAGVDGQRMPNGTIVIEWRGNVEPKIITPTTNSSGIFNFREQLKKDLDQLALQNPMVRGETPNAQLDSYVALQYFEDLRNQLATSDIKGHIISLEQLFRLEMTMARDHYDPSDKRLMKILGRHNTYQLKYFDPINLQKSYDVKITTTGNLATSKAARTQMMISIKEKFPDVLSNELFVDMLGLTQIKKFQNAITSAVSSAEAENHDMMNGEPVLPPTRFEDLIAQWETHRIPMQTLDFKQSPPEIQELFERHVTATEKLMFEMASESQTFAQRLQLLKQFPLFYAPAPINEPQTSLPPEAGPDELAALQGQEQDAAAQEVAENPQPDQMALNL